MIQLTESISIYGNISPADIKEIKRLITAYELYPQMIDRNAQMEDAINSNKLIFDKLEKLNVTEFICKNYMGSNSRRFIIKGK